MLNKPMISNSPLQLDPRNQLIAPTAPFSKDQLPPSELRLPIPSRVNQLKDEIVWHGGKHELESWHFTTNLSCDERHYSLRVQLIILSPKGASPEASVSLCLVEQETGWVREVEKVFPLSKLDICNKVLDIKAGPLEIKGSGSEVSLVADLPDVYVELSGATLKPVLVCNGGGEVNFLGAAHHKFSYPAISVDGIVTVMGKESCVSGSMWFNRQWGNLPKRFGLDRNLEQRQWLNIYPQLSNGINLSVTQTWDFAEELTETNCTTLLPDGTHIVETIEPLVLNDYVESRRSSRRYPRQIELKHDALETCLHISLPYRRREVISKIGNLIRFDGKIIVNGMIYGEEVTGEGFAEMIGRWR